VEETENKLPPSVKSVAALPCEVFNYTALQRS